MFDQITPSPSIETYRAIRKRLGFHGQTIPMPSSVKEHLREIRVSTRKRDVLVLSVTKSQKTNNSLRFKAPWHLMADEECRVDGFSLDQIRGDSRRHPIVVCRHRIMYRLHNELGMSYASIGRAFNRDHHSVIYAVEKHAERIANAP